MKLNGIVCGKEHCIIVKHELLKLFIIKKFTKIRVFLEIFLDALIQASIFFIIP